MNKSPRERLRELIETVGRSVLLEDPAWCRARLLESCGQRPREVQALVTALEHCVVAELVATPDWPSWPEVSKPLVDRLKREQRMNERTARWTVESWALALVVAWRKFLNCPTMRMVSLGSIDLSLFPPTESLIV